jgi:hypothetical protein
MENLLTSMSFWGIAAVFATTSQVVWEYVRYSIRSNSKIPVTSVVTLTQKSLSLVETHYKSLSIFFLSLLTLLVLDSWILPTIRPITYFTILIGAFTYAIKCAIDSWLSESYPNQFNSFLAVILDGKNPSQVITLVLSTSSILLLLICYQSILTWTPNLIYNLFAAYALGSSFIQLIFSLSKTPEADSKIADDNFLIHADRKEILTGAVIACVLLGSTFIDIQAFHSQFNGLGGLFLPLALALSGTLVSATSAIVIRLASKQSSQQTLFAEKLVTTLVMILISFIGVKFFLPQVWVFGTTEYSAIQVFYAAQVGLICGLVISKLIHLYEMAEKIFIEYLYLKSYRITAIDKAVHNSLRVFSSVIPLVLLIGAFLLAYHWVGLYGVCIAIVAMQANLRTELSSEVAELEKLIIRSRKIFSSIS